MQRLTGMGVSPGVASGRAVILIQRLQVVRHQIAPERIEQELRRLEQSRARTREQLVDIRSRIGQRHGELASLFDAQLLMLDDPMLVPRAVALIREQHVNAGWAVHQVFQEFSAVFDEAADPYLRERKGDVADLVGRLRMNLRRGASGPTGSTGPQTLLSEVEEASVLIADELTPSLAAQVDWTRIRGFATDAGSRTYHTAILARSLDVPAMVGLHDASRIIRPGQVVMIDADANELIIDPEPAMLERVRRNEDDRRPAVGAAMKRRARHRPRRPMGFGFASRRMSSFPATWRPRGTQARKGLASIDRSSCSRAADAMAGLEDLEAIFRPKTSSTRSTAACSTRWARRPLRFGPSTWTRISSSGAAVRAGKGCAACD